MLLIIKLSTIFSFFVLIYANSIESTHHLSIISSGGKDDEINAGSKLALQCYLDTQGKVWWMKNNVNITQPDEFLSFSLLNITDTKIEDTGEYTCAAKSNGGIFLNKTIQITVKDHTNMSEKIERRVKAGSLDVSLECGTEGHMLKNFKWNKINDSEKMDDLKDRTKIITSSENYVRFKLTFSKIDYKDNGTYECSAENMNGDLIKGERLLVVIDVPEVEIDVIEAVGTDSIYLKWNVNYHNEPVTEYIIEHLQKNSDEWEPNSEIIDPNSSSLILRNLESGTPHKFRIIAVNSVGRSRAAYSNMVETLNKDPIFVPTISVVERTNSSFTIDLSGRPEDLKDYPYYYTMTVTQENAEGQLNNYRANNMRNIKIKSLMPETDYKIKASACSNYTNQCGRWSDEKKIRTLGEFAENSSGSLYPTGFQSVSFILFSIYFTCRYSIA